MEAVTERINLTNIDKNNWKTYRFDEIAHKISERVDPNETELDTYVGLTHIDGEDIHIRRTGTSDDVKGTKLRFYPGDVIFGRRRAYQRKAAIAATDGFCSAHALVLRANPEVIDPKLFPFFMHSDQFMHRAVDISVGSLSPTINWGKLKGQEFSIPPKEKQTQLVELFWALDEAIEKDFIIKNKQEGLFQAALNNIYSNLFGEEKKLKEVANIIMGQSPPGSSYNESGEGEPFIQGNAEFGKKYPKNSKFTTLPKKYSPKNSILISVRAPVGDLNIADKKYCIGRGLAAIDVNDADLQTFVFNYLKYSRRSFERKSTGSTFKSINKKILKSMPIIIPKKEEIDNYSNRLRIIQNSIKRIDNKIKSSKRLAKSLTNQIF